MCLTMDFFPDGPGVNVTNTGYDLREFKLTCPVIWRGQFTCLPIGGSPGTNVGRARKFRNIIGINYQVAPVKYVQCLIYRFYRQLRGQRR